MHETEKIPMQTNPSPINTDVKFALDMLMAQALKTCSADEQSDANVVLFNLSQVISYASQIHKAISHNMAGSL